MMGNLEVIKMRTGKKQTLIAVAILWGLLQVSVASAVTLRFSPLDQNMELGEQGTVSIMLDEVLEVRTIEVTVTFDGNIISSLEGGGGAAFQDLPCYVWEDFSADENQWTGFAVSMGFDCFVVGPGELFTWNFEAVGYGPSDITAISVVLLDAAGVEYPDVELANGTVLVEGGESAVGDGLPFAQPRITAMPNPFNPMTNIKFWLPEATDARLSIYDMSGRCVRKLLDGPVSSEWTSVRWNGRGDQGRAAPSGIYLYQLVTKKKTLSGRLTLAR